jgi:hypothetical protein
MSDEAKTEAKTEEKTEESAETQAAPAPKKRSAKRKSVWVCIPTNFEEVAVTDPDTGDLTAEMQPTHYSITECPGGEGQKKAVLAALAKHEIDPLNYGDVLLFRATPIDFQIGQQLIIRGI